MTAAAYRQLHATAFPDGRVFEDEWLPGLNPSAPRPPELELQSRWFAGEFGRQFQTTSGQPVEVVQFGSWNHAAGPDFSEVAVRLGGRVLTGCLELDWDVRDWERHGHAENTAYDAVVLHVFFEQPAGIFFTRTSGHREVAQVRLDLAEFHPVGGGGRPAEARCGRCSFPLQEMAAEDVAAMMAAAARQRLERKAARLSRLAALHGWDQAIFQEVAAALGYRRNPWPMTLLAQRLPLRLLATHPAGAPALLFGAAGFLQSQVYEKAPAETRDYLRSLWQTWWKHRDEFCAVSPPRWHLAGTRPQNHPHRRMGALTQVVAQWKKIRPGFDLPAPGLTPPSVRLAEALSELTHPYWDHHFTLTSASAAHPLALIGASRISDILANVAFPCYARRPDAEPSAWAAFTALPATLDNEKSRRAALRLLGHRPDAATLQKKLFQQQALLQIYDDFCLQDSSDCAACLFPEQLARWRYRPSSPDRPADANRK